MSFYWQLIVNFQIQILRSVHSIYEENLKLHNQILFYFLKWRFALNKYKYCWWAANYWFDLVSLYKLYRDVYNEIRNGNFSFLKNTIFVNGT